MECLLILEISGGEFTTVRALDRIDIHFAVSHSFG